MQERCSSKSLACRLACLAIFIAASVSVGEATTTEDDTIDRSTGERCGDRTRCQWNIPPDRETGCCPREAGQSCHPEVQELCNTEFGFRCVDKNSSLPTEGVGICRGPFNLTPTAIEQKQIILEWIHFAPKDYQFEYVLLFTKDSYHRDISRWTLRDCGTEARCAMRRLSPATTYLVRMAVWDDVRALTLGDKTEIIAVTTKGVESCEGTTENEFFEVGQSFIHEGEENCTCLSSGEFQCHRLCPGGIPQMEEGCQAVMGEECQYNITCNLQEEFEENEEELCNKYPEGSELRSDCRVCRCERKMLKCSYTDVCNVLSPKPSCKHIKAIKIPGQCCPEWDCEDVCEHENKSYSRGELFQSQSCGLCQCQPSGKVECISNCPPVEMVPPSPACPSPHVKRSGCCDTLHCFHAESDLFSYVHNLVALYTTSVTLTLSFEVEPMCEIDGRPDYCYYKIQYANTATLQESHRWNNRIVHPVDVLDDGLPSYAHPIDVLTKDTAIVINGRAVVTLTGMYPRTEFYVVVTQEEEVREDMTEVEDTFVTTGHGSLAAKVVVKTRPLQNVTSCFYSGKERKHGETVSQTCNQMCMCQLGQIVCHSTCVDESIIIAASISCPKPRLEKRDGECCPKWRCNPSVSGCHYKNTVLRSGQVVSDGCQECVCKNLTMQCVSLCPPASASPRTDCVLTNHSGHCCPQWSCPLEKLSPIAVESSILLKFIGTCQSPVTNFKKNLSKEIVAHVSHLMNCTNAISSFSLCNDLRADVECKPMFSEEGDRNKRSAEEELFFTVLVSVRRNFSSEKDPEIVFRAGLDIQRLLNFSFAIQLPSGSTFESSPGIRLRKPVYICDRGFSYKNGHCVLSEIDFMGSQLIQIPVTPVDISSDVVTFQWPPLDDNIQKHISSLHINYRHSGVVAWTSTKELAPWRTSITVTSLQPGTSYVGTLVAVRQGQDDNKWLLGDASFKTSRVSEDAALSSIDLQEVSVSANAIILYWGNLSDAFWKQVEIASILYWASNSNLIHKQQIENRKLPFMKIEGLSTSTEYKAQLTAVLSDGKTVRSQSLQIATLPTEKCDHSFLVPLLLACCGTVLLGLGIFLVFMVMRSRKKDKHEAFENKTYGVSLENNTGSAHPAATSLS